VNILQVNNYHFVRGGAEKYYFALLELLEKNGHNIRYFSVEDQNNEPSEYSRYFGNSMSFDCKQGFISKVETAFRMWYSFENKKKITKLLSDYPSDIAHAHNIYHRVCPSILDALNKNHVPVVMTLHDHKLCCAVYTFYRNGQICSECITLGKKRIVANRCTKGSFILSTVHWIESILHDFLRLYEKNISYFICPSIFSYRKHAEIGIHEKKLVHIPNFIGVERYKPKYEGEYALFVGRLSREKGILTLLQAVNGLDIKIKIVGDGPMKTEYENYARVQGINNAVFEGYKSGEELQNLFRNAAFVIFPSECFENAPMTILEAFAYGKPVIGSGIGGIPEMVINNETGFIFKVGNYQELKEKIRHLLLNPFLMTEMGKKARKKVEEEYNAELHYGRLMGVYKKTLS
jgi:glycosyltransferase involved in cell wall biosynthesis